MTESKNQVNNHQPYKLVENIHYNVVSEIAGTGWAANFTHTAKPIPLIAWLTVKTPSNSEYSNGLNGVKKVGLVCLDGVNVVPCDLVDTFECYTNHIPTIEVYGG